MAGDLRAVQGDPRQQGVWQRFARFCIRSSEHGTPGVGLLEAGLILFGEIAPGQAVTIKGLTEALGAGITPVRS